MTKSIQGIKDSIKHRFLSNVSKNLRYVRDNVNKWGLGKEMEQNGTLLKRFMISF